MIEFKKIVVIVLLIQYFGLGAQNLVPNPSFETYTACPSAPSQANNAVPWYGTNTQSDYFNTCATGNLNIPNTAYGYQLAKTGNAFVGQYFLNGLGVNYREYIQVALTNSLVTGNCYLVKFHINCINKIIHYACNNLAAHISSFPYTTTGSPATSYTPQIYLVNNPIVKDTLNWTEIGGIYTAIGGESHITIGNFKNDANTDTLTLNSTSNGAAYYYIDDVSVEQITTPQWQLKDTMIIGGDSVLIGPLYSGLTCNWFDMLGTPIGSGSGLWVKPLTTTSYVLQQTFCNNTFSDTVTVYVSAVGINDPKQFKNSINFYPQPSKDVVNISLSYFYEPTIQIQITDVNGKIVRSSELLVRNGKTQIETSGLADGVYVIQIVNSQHQIAQKRLVIAK